MDFRSLIQSLDTINEDSKVHKGTYGTSHGKEDVRDQYGHRVGKVDKEAGSKKDQPKKGRGRPKKGSDDSGEVKTYDTKSLHNVFGGGKKPSKEIGKTSKKHSLKEYIDEVETNKKLDEDAGQFTTRPIPQQHQQLQQVMGPDGRPMLDQPVPTDTALRVANALNVSDVNEEESELKTGWMNKQHQDFYNKNPHFKDTKKEIVSVGDRLASKIMPSKQTVVKKLPFGSLNKVKEGSIQGGVWTADSPKPGQPNVPAPSGDPEGVPKPSANQPWRTMRPRTQDSSKPMGTIKGGVWTADPPKPGEKGVPAPVPVDEKMMNEKAKSKAQQKFFGMVHAMQKGKKVPGASKELKDVAKSMGKKDVKDFAKTKHKGLPQHVDETSFEDQGVVEGKQMKTTQLTEGAMKDLLINFHDDVHSHMGDGSMFDLKKATNVQQAEEILKALVKHSDEYNHLDHVNQNEIVNQVMKHLAHEKELPFNTLANVDKQRFAQRTPTDLSSYRQHPGAQPGSSFSKPGSPMAVPRTTTGSNGFLKTLSTPTIKESSDMKDKQFENWERELNNLLNEGITVSTSTGQQGAPDSVSINATEHDAGELMSILRNSGLGVFGGQDKADTGGYGVVSQGEEEPEGHGTEPELGPDVVGDGDDMLELIKKMSGIATDSGTPGSVEVDYEDEGGEEDSGEEEHSYDDEDSSEEDSEDQDSGEESDEGDEEEVDENLEVRANPAGASSAEQAKQIGAQFPQQGGKEPNLAYKIGEGNKELSELTAEYPGGSTKLPEGDMEEGNAFTNKLRKTPQGDSFKMGNKTYKDTSSIEEGDMEEGAGVMHYKAQQAKADGEKSFKLGDKEFPVKEEEHMHEGEETCNECGMYESECGCDHVEEGYANDAGGNAMGETELMKLKELLSHGNDLHRQKHSQATGNIQKVTMETKLLKDSTDLLVDWKKLSGIK